MDLSKPVLYRGIDINGATLQTGRMLRGITVESIDYSTVEGIGYTEKRAATDGIHASDVYLGPRAVSLQGLIYASSLAELFDYLHIIRATFSPTSAYQESPGDRGFLPMTFSQPTLDVDSFPSGEVPLQMYLRPTALPRFLISRDRLVGVSAKPQATSWGVQLIAKDPRVYVNPAQSISVAGGPWPATMGTAINRGDYETPLNIILVIGASTPAAGNFRVYNGFGGIDMTIAIEAAANRVYRWYGDDRVLMVQDTSAGDSAPEVLRMDLVTFATKNRKPMVPASINPPTRPFSSTFYYSSTVAVASGSRLFWYEAFA